MVHRFWALHSTVDQDGEVGHENIVLILLYLCCLDFLTHLVKMILLFKNIKLKDLEKNSSFLASKLNELVVTNHTRYHKSVEKSLA